MLNTRGFLYSTGFVPILGGDGDSSGGSSSTSINQITDITISDGEEADYLRFDGSVWRNVVPFTLITDVTVNFATEGDILQFDSGDNMVANSIHEIVESTGETSSVALGDSSVAYLNSVSIGNKAGESITTGTNNTFIGYSAGSNTTIGSNNVAIGNGVTPDDTDTDNTVSIGTNLNNFGECVLVGRNLLPEALFTNLYGTNLISDGDNNSSGTSNQAFGTYSLQKLAEGSRNVSMGCFNGSNLRHGDENILVGITNGANIIDSSNHTLVGSQNNTVGTVDYSSIFGHSNVAAGSSVSIGSDNVFNAINTVAIGRQNGSLGNSTTAAQNTVAIGNSNLPALTIGPFNVSIGYTNFSSLTEGEYNIGLGSELATSLTTGSKNILIGKDNVPGMTTATNNIIIGNDIDSDGDITTSGNNIVIGNNVVADMGVECLIIGSSATFGTTVNGGASGHVCLGGASVSGSGNAQIAIGWDARSSASSTGSTICIGTEAEVNADFGVAVGHEAVSNHVKGCAIGFNADTTAVNQIALGDAFSTTAVGGALSVGALTNVKVHVSGTFILGNPMVTAELNDDNMSVLFTIQVVTDAPEYAVYHVFAQRTTGAITLTTTLVSGTDILDDSEIAFNTPDNNTITFTSQTTLKDVSFTIEGTANPSSSDWLLTKS